jgi:hypothetical protein
MILIPVIWNVDISELIQSWTVYYDIPTYLPNSGWIRKSIIRRAQCILQWLYALCICSNYIQIWLCREALQSLKISDGAKKDHWRVICSEKENLCRSNTTLFSFSFFMTDIFSCDILFCSRAHPRDEKWVLASGLCRTSCSHRHIWRNVLLLVCPSTYLCRRYDLIDC